MPSGVVFEPASYTESGINDDAASIGTSSCSSDTSANEFRKLKIERKERRRNRRLVRSISGQINSLIGNQSRSPPDSEALLLIELADRSRLSMTRNEHEESDQQ